jgi:hypothetical protein
MHRENRAIDFPRRINTKKDAGNLPGGADLSAVTAVIVAGLGSVILPVRKTRNPARKSYRHIYNYIGWII